MNLRSLQQVLNDDTRSEFLRRLALVYWDARRMEENFVHSGGKVCNSFVSSPLGLLGEEIRKRSHRECREVNEL